MSAGEAVQPRSERRSVSRSLRPIFFGVTIVTILGLLFGLPWWTLVFSRAQWPAPVQVAGSLIFGVALLSFPALMYLGHSRHRQDWAARLGDSILGIIWVLFVWALLGNVALIGLGAAGVADPIRSRV